MKKILPTILTAASACSVAAQECSAHIHKQHGAIALDGCLSAQSIEQLISLLDKDVKLLLVKSTGGDVSAGLTLAKRINELQLKVVLRGNCYSSCANYILPASQNVQIEEGTLILFHGDARTTSQRIEYASIVDVTTKIELEKVVRTEKRLSQKIPKMTALHEMQQVMSAKYEEIVILDKKEKTFRCKGRGEPTWVASLNWLLSESYVFAIVPRDESLFQNVSSVAQTPNERYVNVESDPRLACTKMRVATP